MKDPNRTPTEYKAALDAISYALAAKGDPVEYVNRTKHVPQWIFDETPMLHQQLIDAAPAALEVLRSLAETGDEEATQRLVQHLEDIPALQTMFPPRRS